MIDNVENFYFALLEKGYYLPNFSSRAITFEFL